MGLELVLFIVSTALSVVQAVAAKKKAAAAADAALGQDVRPSASAEPIDILYGEIATSGTRVHTSTRSTFATAGSGNLLPRAGRLGSLTKGKRNEILSTQHVVGAGDISDIINMWTDDQSPTSEFITGSSFAHWQHGGISDPVASQFGRGGSNRFTELTYATNVWKLNRKEPQYSGAPTPLYFVRGNRLFDPRDPAQSQTDRDTWVYSNNLALVLLDYLTHPVYGLGWDYAEDIDSDAFSAAADICGQAVQSTDAAALATTFGSLDGSYPYGPGSYRFNYQGFGFNIGDGFMSGFNAYSGGQSSVFGDRDTVLRHEFNGNISTGATHRDNIATIIALIEGAEFFRSPTGRWKFVVPDSMTPEAAQSVATIDEGDLTRSIGIRYADATNKFNQLDMRFANVNKDFADDTVTFPPTGSDFHLDLLAEDNNVTLKTLQDLRGLSDKYHAASIAANKIAASRRETYTFQTRPSGFLYEPGDVVRVIDELTDTDVFVRIRTTKVMTTLNVEFTGILFDKDDYGWRLDEIESIQNRDDILGTLGIPTITSAIVDNDSKNVTIIFSDPDNDATVNAYAVEARKVGETDFVQIGTTPDLRSDDTQTFLHVPDNSESEYEYRVIATTTDSRTGDPSTVMASAMVEPIVAGQGEPGAPGVDGADAAIGIYSAPSILFAQDDSSVYQPVTSAVTFEVYAGGNRVPRQDPTDLATPGQEAELQEGFWQLLISGERPDHSVSPLPVLTSIPPDDNMDGENDVIQYTVNNFVSGGVIRTAIRYRAPGQAIEDVSTVIYDLPVSGSPKGTDGEMGEDGDDGIQGPQGIQGEAGAAGTAQDARGGGIWTIEAAGPQEFPSKLPGAAFFDVANATILGNLFARVTTVAGVPITPIDGDRLIVTFEGNAISTAFSDLMLAGGTANSGWIEEEITSFASAFIGNLTANRIQAGQLTSLGLPPVAGVAPTATQIGTSLDLGSGAFTFGNEEEHIRFNTTDGFVQSGIQLFADRGEIFIPSEVNVATPASTTGTFTTDGVLQFTPPSGWELETPGGNGQAFTTTASVNRKGDGEVTMIWDVPSVFRLPPTGEGVTTWAFTEAGKGSFTFSSLSGSFSPASDNFTVRATPTTDGTTGPVDATNLRVNRPVGVTLANLNTSNVTLAQLDGGTQFLVGSPGSWSFATGSFTRRLTIPIIHNTSGLTHNVQITFLNDLDLQ